MSAPPTKNDNQLFLRIQNAYTDRQKRRFCIIVSAAAVAVAVAVLIIIFVVLSCKSVTYQDCELDTPICLTSPIPFANVTTPTYQTSTAPSETLNNKYAYVVIIFIIYENGTGACGGTFVQTNYILTAAHCFDKAESYNVYPGSKPIDELEVSMALPVDKIIIHELYNDSSFEHDIALIKLKKLVNLDVPMKTIPLLIANSTDLEGVRCEVPGKASLVMDDSLDNNIVLKYVTVKSKKNSICNDTFRVFGDSDNQPRPGDSGSGLVCGFQQVAVLSTYTFDCNATSYIHLSYYYCDWIAKQMEPSSC